MRPLSRYRYWPVEMPSTCRPDASSPSPRSVRTYTIRSPFLPEIRVEVLGPDVSSLTRVGTFDLDLHVQSSGAKDGRVDHVFPVGGSDDDHVLQRLDAVDLR